MIYDPVVEEIRHFRAEHAAKYENDLVKICKALREKQKNSTRRVVSRSPLLKLDKTG